MEILPRFLIYRRASVTAGLLVYPSAVVHASSATDALDIFEANNKHNFPLNDWIVTVHVPYLCEGPDESTPVYRQGDDDEQSLWRRRGHQRNRGYAP